MGREVEEKVEGVGGGEVTMQHVCVVVGEWGSCDMALREMMLIARLHKPLAYLESNFLN